MKTINFSTQNLRLIKLPFSKSHKGDNGRVLVIGGSSLFHSASLWAAELLAHFVDLVFYYSPWVVNQQICLYLKQRFRNGIVIIKEDLDAYVAEADVILIGPGLLREGPEGQLANKLTNQLLNQYPDKKFVIDAGALQQLKLTNIRPQHILTPHYLEYLHLFARYENNFSRLLTDYPATYLLKKNGTDYVFSYQTPSKIVKIDLGNEGLTKGGSGDLLAALVSALYVKNRADLSASAASFFLKTAADTLYQAVGPFYTTSELLKQIPYACWSRLKLKP